MATAGVLLGEDKPPVEIGFGPGDIVSIAEDVNSFDRARGLPVLRPPR